MDQSEIRETMKESVVSIDNSTNNVGQVVHVTNNYFISADVSRSIKKSSSEEHDTPKKQSGKSGNSPPVNKNRLSDDEFEEVW